MFHYNDNMFHYNDNMFHYNDNMFHYNNNSWDDIKVLTGFISNISIILQRSRSVVCTLA